MRLTGQTQVRDVSATEGWPPFALIRSSPAAGQDAIIRAPFRGAPVAGVLPSFGEEGVQSCTLRDLVPVDPDSCGMDIEGIEGAVYSHVAMTRAARKLVIPTTAGAMPI